MFQTLLESRSSRARRAWGTAVSIGAHTAAIALAIAATARATAVRPVQPPVPTDIVWTIPHAPAPAPRSQDVAPASQAFRRASDITWSRVTTIDLATPPMSVGSIPAPAPASFDSGSHPLVPGPFGEGASGLVGSDDKVYELNTVEQAAMPQPGNRPPVYPPTLRAARLEGSVVARFIVDTSGRAEPASIAFRDVSHPAFAEAVRHALLRSRYLPARVGGRAVRQLVEQRFTFALQDFGG